MDAGKIDGSLEEPNEVMVMIEEASDGMYGTLLNVADIDICLIIFCRFSCLIL